MQKKMIRAIVVGRHTPDFGTLQVEVVELLNVTFPATGEETLPVLKDLAKKAVEAGAVLLFQNVPTPLAAALIRLMVHQQTTMDLVKNPWEGYTSQDFAKDLVPLPKMGVVVSVPSAMPSGSQTKEIQVWFNQDGLYGTRETALQDIVSFANPRATVQENGLKAIVSVEAPRKFEFSHIEWLYEPK